MTKLLLALSLAVLALPGEETREISEELGKPPKAGDGTRQVTAIAANTTVAFSIGPVFVATHFTEDYAHSIVIPSGTTRVRFELVATTPGADIDLFVRIGQVPRLSGTTVIADFRGQSIGNDTIVVEAPVPGTYYSSYGLYTFGQVVGGTIRVIIEGPPVCSYTLSGALTSIPGTGGSGSFQVFAPAGCTWTAVSPASWITVTGGGSGSGNGTVSFSLSPNPTGFLRFGVFLVGGRSFRVDQPAAPSCSYSVQPAALNIAASGGNHLINVTATAGCPWSASTSAPWVFLSSGSSGTGSGVVALSVSANPGTSQRSTTVDVAGTTVALTQAAAACNYQLSALTADFPATGGNGQVVVSVGDGCSWSAINSSFFITLSGGLSGSGSGTVTFSVSPNPGMSQRNAILVIAGQQFSVTQRGTTIPPPGTTQANRFVPLDPCRIVETRPEYNFEGRQAGFGPPFMVGGETRTLTFPLSNVCRNIPFTARAVVLNITLVPRGFVDFVTVFPGGETRPEFYTARSQDGLVVANSAIVKTGSGGTIGIYASHATDLIIDITGYFTDDASVSNLVFYPLTPCRLIETRSDYRSPPGPFGPFSVASRETRNFRFPANPYCPVPVAAAYSVTVTVVPTLTLAYLTAWPSGRGQPNVSSMNSPSGRVLANSIFLPASSDGSVNIFAFDKADIIVDINGYFAPDDGVNGLFYYPARQCRLAHTNDASFAGSFGGPQLAGEVARTIPVQASPRCTDIPASARAYSLNATVIPNGSPMPFLTVWPTGQPRPNASVINAFAGQTVSSAFIVPAGAGGAVDLFALRPTQMVLEISGYFSRD